MKHITAIETGGETRSIVAEERYDDIPVRAWDVTHNRLVQDATIPSNAVSGVYETAALTLPALWHPTDVSQSYDMTVAFQYYNAQENEWITLRTQDQESYFLNISTNHTNLAQIAAAGYNYTASAWGYFPQISLRSTSNGSTALCTVNYINAAQTSTPVTGTINVPVNEEGARPVYLQYSVNEGISWTNMSSANQPLLRNCTITFNNSGSVTGSVSVDVTITVSGNFNPFILTGTGAGNKTITASGTYRFCAGYTGGGGFSEPSTNILITGTNPETGLPINHVVKQNVKFNDFSVYWN